MDQTSQRLLNQLLKTLNSWNQDLKETRDDYKKSAEALDKAREAFVKSTDSRGEKALKYAPYIVIILILIVIAGFVLTGHCGKVGWGDYNISIVCPEKSTLT